MYKIFSLLLRELTEGRGAVLTVIVSKEGSAPRGTGSMMLTGASGRLAGTIGGGAVEKIALEDALKLLETGKSDVREYQLHPSGEENTGMICGGSTSVFFQYFPAGQKPWAQLVTDLMTQLDAGRSGWLRLAVNDFPVLLPEETDGVSEQATVVAPSQNAYHIPLPAEKRAVLFGGGHIALELAPLLKRVNFRVIVFDDRPEFSNPARFPMAAQTICGTYAAIDSYLTLRENDYAVVITEGHQHDFEVEQQLLRLPLAYIGAIGSKTKTAAVNQRLLEAGYTSRDLERLHAPIGLKIKAATPAEIAVSIAAEMILVRAEQQKNDQSVCPMHEN